ncbi:MAG: two-component regulator propeller domain-containing protein [Immundisolibacter sp.]|uniref:ligand-binding sensor domain-containing protein n=1 Tax=Immundisolibacter sp. TaxID=1934948 RepID=UPI003D0D7C94
MALPFKLAGLGLIALGAALAAAYQLGRQQAEPPAAATPISAGASAAGGPQREGKVGADATQKFTHFRVGNKNVKRIFVDGDVVWVGTSGGAVRYDTRTDEYKLYDTGSGLLSNGVFHVGKLGERIVLGTYGGGLALLDPATQQLRTYNIPEGLGDAFVYDVLKAKSGDVWIATWSGVNRVRGGDLDDRSKWELHTVDSTKGGLPNDWVYGLAEGPKGEIWLATEGGLSRFHDGRWQHWKHADGLGAPYAKVKDQIAFKNDPAKVSEHHAKQKQEMGLADVDVAYNPNYIVSLAVDAQGVVWAGTWGGGLSRFDGKAWTQYTVTEGLPGNHVFMLHIDPQGLLWIGTNNGLAKLKDGRFEVLTTHDGLFGNAVFSMATTPDGTRWIGSFGGVAKLRPS